MKIVDYRVTPIAFSDPPLRAASGLHASWALRTIVEIVSDDGITGVSETHGGRAVVDDLLAVGELVVGRDPFQLAELEHILFAGRRRGRPAPGGARRCGRVGFRRRRVRSARSKWLASI